MSTIIRQTKSCTNQCNQFYCRFKLAVDASNIGADLVLLEEDENAVDHVLLLKKV